MGPIQIQNLQQLSLKISNLHTPASTATRRRVPPRSFKTFLSLYVPATAAFSSVPMAPVLSLSLSESLEYAIGHFSYSVVSLLVLRFIGKTTILKILGGKHMVEPDMVRVLGRSAFHDTTLVSSGDLCYLGGEVRSCFHFTFALTSTTSVNVITNVHFGY